MQNKLRKVLALLSCMVMLCTVLPFGAMMPVTAATTNLITNGDFEGGDYTGWVKNNSTLTVSADAAHSGSYGIHLYTYGAWAGLFQDVNLENGALYSFSFWYKSGSDAKVNVGVEAKTKDANGGYNNKTPFLNPGSTSVTTDKSVTEWTKVETVFATATEGDVTTRFTFFRGTDSNNTAENASSVYLDDIVLTKLSSNAVKSSDAFSDGTAGGWALDSTSSVVEDPTGKGYGYVIKTNQPTGYGGEMFNRTFSGLQANTDYYLSLMVYQYTETTSANPAFLMRLPDSVTDWTVYTQGLSSQASNNYTPRVNFTTGTWGSVKSWRHVAVRFNTGDLTSVTIKIRNYRADHGHYYFDNIRLIDATVATDEPVVKPDVPTDFGRVDNGGFEDATGGWTIKYANRTNADSYSGDYSLLTTSLKKYGVFAFTNIDVVPNSDYTISFKLKLAEQGTESKFRLYTRETSDNSSGKTSVPQWDITDATTEWKTYTKVINSQELNTMYLSFAQGTDETAHTCSTFYIDDIILTGPTPTDEPDPDPTGNLIVNGDFETGSKDPWTSGSGSAAITVNTANVHGGSYGAMIPARNRTFTAKQDVTVKANTNYTVTFWYKSTDAAQEIHLLFGVYATDATASNATALATQVVLDNTKSDWTQVTYVFNSGDNTSVRVAFGSDNSSCLVTNYMYVDDIVMVEGGEISDEPEEYVGNSQKDKTSGSDIRVMTYNVLADNDEANGGMHFGTPIANRGTRAAAMINYYQPDVIAFQEFTTHWYTAIRANCPQYEFVNANLDGVTDSMCSALAYNKSVLRVVTSGVYKMSNTYWEHQRMRYLNWAVFEVIATGERFIASSTHPDAGKLLTAGSDDTKDFTGDGVYEPAGYWRPTQMGEIVEQLSSLYETYKCPIIASGDYNCNNSGMSEDTVSYNIMIDAGYTDATNGTSRDHIFYNSMANPLYNAKVSDAGVSGVSDHDPYFADIQFLDEFATPIKNAKDYIKTQGRNTLKDGALWLDFSASGIEFSANCEGKVALNLNVKSIKNTDPTYGGIYFTVIVDGVKVDRAQCRITSTGNVELVLAENLPAGNHTFEVYRQTEHRGAEVGISSIVMEGTFNEKPADSNLYIEFIGDSISTGYGALGDVSNDTHNDNANSPLFQDATIAYPYLTAKALGADFSDVAYSGIGAKYGWQDPNMQTFYPYQRWQYDRTTLYDFNARQPDVVVIALGTNDISQGPSGDTAARKAGYQEMLDLVRSKNPNAKIVWIVGMMDDTDNTMIANLIEENGGAAEDLYCCELTTNRVGAGWHPSEAGQQVFADELVAFLNSTVLALKDEVMDGQAGLANLYSGGNHGKSSRMEMTESTLGLAFLFRLNAQGVAPKPGTHYDTDLSNATVDVFGNGTNYKLVSMGALVTNNPHVGMENMTMSDVNAGNCINIEAQYLFSTPTDDYAEFAVRVTNIPSALDSVILYARAYYVFEYDDGRLITVYDDVFSANYKHQYEDNDGVLDW